MVGKKGGHRGWIAVVLLSALYTALLPVERRVFSTDRNSEWRCMYMDQQM